MKVLLCTGSPHSGHEQVFEKLVQAGVANAQPTSQGAMTPQALQAQLLQSHEVNLNGVSQLEQLRPGKVWGQLAADLFMANISHPVWGWADHQTAALMDFWQDFDPQVRLLLVYSTPQDYLAQVLDDTQPVTPKVVAAALDQWMRWNTALLRYYHRNPTRCVLLNGDLAVEQPYDLKNLLITQWQVGDLQTEAVSPTPTRDYMHLQRHLIGRLIDPLHPALTLSQELDGTAQLRSISSNEPLAGATANAAWSDWLGMRAQLAELAQSNSELIANNAVFTRAKGALVAQLADQQKESELLLLQLHQVQEELEHYFILYKDLQQQQHSNASGFVTDFWLMHQPTELCVDMRQNVVGSNWYHPESDGCWAGPALVSSVQMPPLQAGSYTLMLDVVDAMHPDIVQSMVLEALGQSVGFEIEPLSPDSDFPLVCKAQLYIAPAATPVPWLISLRFTHLVSPAERGSDDRRDLAIRLQALRLRKNT